MRKSSPKDGPAIRRLVTGLFGLFAWELVRHGAALRRSGEVSTTLQLPGFRVPYVMAFACVAVVLVALYHLFEPGKTRLQP